MAFWFLWPWLEMMAPGATERGVTITWIAGQVEHAAQMIGALTPHFANFRMAMQFFFFDKILNDNAFFFFRKIPNDMQFFSFLQSYE